jgi:hypothetical protein
MFFPEKEQRKDTLQTAMPAIDFGHMTNGSKLSLVIIEEEQCIPLALRETVSEHNTMPAAQWWS